MKKYSFQGDVLPLKNELFRLAFRITHDSAEAEDIVQETMLRVWDRRESWEDIEDMSAYCHTVCRNMSLDRNDKAGRKGKSISEMSREPLDGSYSADPMRQVEVRDRIQLVQRLFDRLPEKQRSIMHLREIEGKSYREIALIMEISEDQVKINLFRSRQIVKKQLSKTEDYGL